MKISADITLTICSKLLLSNLGTNHSHVYLINDVLKKLKHPICGILAKSAQPSLIMRYLTNPEHILQNNYPFQNVKVKKYKERLRKCSRLKQTKEVWQ